MRTSPTDFRVGDLLKIRLQDIMSPYGDAVLEMKAGQKSPPVDEVFSELAKAYEQRVCTWFPQVSLSIVLALGLVFQAVDV